VGVRIFGNGNMLMRECEYFDVGIHGCGCENTWTWEYVGVSGCVNILI